jgi:hypothetical protein
VTIADYAVTITDKLVIERRVMPVTFNVARQTAGQWAIRKELAAWRAWARNEGEGWQLLWPVTVQVQHLRRNRAAIPDVGAPILAVKAAIDGLVDAGVLPGDDPRYVQRLTFEAPEIVGWHGLRLTITTTPGGTH